MQWLKRRDTEDARRAQSIGAEHEMKSQMCNMWEEMGGKNHGTRRGEPSIQNLQKHQTNAASCISPHSAARFRGARGPLDCKWSG